MQPTCRPAGALGFLVLCSISYKHVAPLGLNTTLLRTWVNTYHTSRPAPACPDDTVDLETVTEQDARELRKISGESLWNIGTFGAFVPGGSGCLSGCLF